MPRVLTKKAQTRRYTTRDKRIPEGKVLGELKPNRKCGRCQDEIKPGDTYREWSFRYGGTHYRCAKTTCTPRPSELTQSKMSTVYAAQEDFDVSSAETYHDILNALEEFAEQVREVAQEYAEAAENFGGQGENAERSDALESYADDVENALQAYDEEDVTCDAHNEEQDQDVISECEDCKTAQETNVADMRQAAEDAVNECPL